MKKLFVLLTAAALSVSLIACGNTTSKTAEKESVSENVSATETGTASSTADVSEEETEMPEVAEEPMTAEISEAAENAEAKSTDPASDENTAVSAEMIDSGSENITVLTNMVTDGALDTTELFSERDLRQSADLTEAQYLTLSDGQNVGITAEGVYVISGTAVNATIIIDVEDNEKVQIVLDGVTITNDSAPCIYVKNADKTFVTTTDSENSLSVTGTFEADGDTNTDAVIYSKDDLVLNGTGILNISSVDNGITSKDDLKITGGTISISCTADAIEAGDSVRIADGILSIYTYKDGIHVENEDDNAKGFVYICGGTMDITAGDDGIHATTIVQIDGGSVSINAAEGIEGTWVQLNGGSVYISASDDGINGASKSSAYSVTVEINGGDLAIDMGSGDTDAIDSNGNLYINGGTISINAQFPFDYDGTAEYNGGTIIVNGEETYEITNQFGGMGGFGPMGGGSMPGGDSWGGGYGPGGFH